MNNDNKFSSGFLLGLIIGGGAVFLLGTKTGKNLLKIVSEQGLDGLSNILEDYDLSSLEQEDDQIYEETPAKETSESSSNGHTKESKKRFFRRIKK